MSQKPESAPTVAATWGGYFTFVNQLGQNITHGTAKHWTTDFGTESIDLAGLVEGQTSSPKTFVTSTTNTDRWAFDATLSDGTSYSVAEKDCGFESEDAGGTVKLQAIVASGTKSFYIVMPNSSACSTSF